LRARHCAGRTHSISSTTSLFGIDAWENIVTYQAEAFARSLRQARRGKGWSQRVLSAKAGIPQAHISRIESGAVDVKVSTLVEIARLLDMEVVLAPRATLLALEAVIREAEAGHGLPPGGRPTQAPAHSLEDDDSRG